MTIELVKILEAALEYLKSSNKWFEQYERTNDEDDWAICKEYDMRAKGMLEAYEILTGRHVLNGVCFVREELLEVA